MRAGRTLPTGHHQQNRSALGSPGDAGVGTADGVQGYMVLTAGQSPACHLQFFRTGEHLSISSLELGLP